MIRIHVPQVENAARLTFVLDHIFLHTLKVSYTLVDNPDTAHIYYGAEGGGSNVPLKISNFGRLGECDFNDGTAYGYPCMYPCSVEGYFNLDIFSAVFYCLGGLLELQHKGPLDVHGRKLPEGNWVFDKGLIQFPIVDFWIEQLKKDLEVLGLSFPSRKINWFCTMDVDFGYKYKGKGWMLILGAIAKGLLQLKFGEQLMRLRVISGQKSDPWDVYEQFANLVDCEEIAHRVFILNGPRTKYDKALPLNSTGQQRLIRKMDSLGLNLGIHPSYFTSEIEENFGLELSNLRTIVDQPIDASRQHYLKFSFPSLCDTLLTHGIQEDFSLGFSGVSGFRWGSCNPSFYYDLEAEQATNLKLYPSCFMEATYANSGLGSEEAKKVALALIDACKAFGGTFVSIYHENNFAKPEWRGLLDNLFENIAVAKQA